MSGGCDEIFVKEKKTIIFTRNVETVEAKNLGKKLFHPWIQSRGEGEGIPLSEAKRLIRGRHGEGVTCEAVYSLTVRPRVRLTLTFRRRENRV